MDSGTQLKTEKITLNIFAVCNYCTNVWFAMLLYNGRISNGFSWKTIEDNKLNVILSKEIVCKKGSEGDFPMFGIW